MHAHSSTPKHLAPRPHGTARRVVVTGLAALAASTALVAAAGPAGAAPSCAGVVISAQGTSGPRVVSDRVHEIKREIIPASDTPELPFGQAIRGLAQMRC